MLTLLCCGRATCGGPTYARVLVHAVYTLRVYLLRPSLAFSLCLLSSRRALATIGGRTSLSSFPMGTIPHGIYNNNGHERGRRVDLYLPVRFSFSSTPDRVAPFFLFPFTFSSYFSTFPRVPFPLYAFHFFQSSSLGARPANSRAHVKLSTSHFPDAAIKIS